MVVGEEGTNGGLWCSPVAKTSRPTSSAFSAIVTIALIRSCSVGVPSGGRVDRDVADGEDSELHDQLLASEIPGLSWYPDVAHNIVAESTIPPPPVPGVASVTPPAARPDGPSSCLVTSVPAGSDPADGGPSWEGAADGGPSWDGAAGDGPGYGWPGGGPYRAGSVGGHGRAGGGVGRRRLSCTATTTTAASTSITTSGMATQASRPTSTPASWVSISVTSMLAMSANANQFRRALTPRPAPGGSVGGARAGGRG